MGKKEKRSLNWGLAFHYLSELIELSLQMDNWKQKRSRREKGKREGEGESKIVIGFGSNICVHKRNKVSKSGLYFAFLILILFFNLLALLYLNSTRSNGVLSIC